MNIKLHLEIYDIKKIVLKNIPIYFEEGFGAWYILQYYKKYNYKPFITKIFFIEKVSGKIWGFY